MTPANPFAKLEMSSYLLEPDTAARLPSPALLLYPQAVRHNIETMRELLDGELGRWRPHIKTCKTPAILAMLLVAGVRSFKCATLREARALLETAADCGHPDIDLLVAYPHVQPVLHELGKLAETHTEARISVLSEDPGHAAQVDLRLGVYVDLDVGMGRTGADAHNGERVLAIARAAGERFGGLHAYEGHVIEADEALRLERARPAYERILALRELLERGRVQVPEIVTSGTPGFRAALGFAAFGALDGCVHRISPGTVVYHDLRSQLQVPELTLLPAALIFSRLISKPGSASRGADPGMRITLDAGSKALAVDAGHPCCVALGHPEFEAAIPSEEHLPATIHGERLPDLGDAFYLIPRHVCPTVNLAEEAALVEDGRITEIVPVAARAHDLRL
jgi:D-serine deaminase-like pyridoxal phosphate-dependent protein